MIKLYSFGPYFGLPDASPFVLKTMTLLKFAGLRYVEDHSGYAPRAQGQASLYRRRRDDRRRFRPSSASISKKPMASISTPASRRSSAPPAGRSRKCWRSIIIGCWCRPAGSTTAISRAGRRNSSPACPAFDPTAREGADPQESGAQPRGAGPRAAFGDELAELGRRDIEALSVLLGDKPYLFGDAPSARRRDGLRLGGGDARPRSSFRRCARRRGEGQSRRLSRPAARGLFSELRLGLKISRRSHCPRRIAGSRSPRSPARRSHARSSRRSTRRIPCGSCPDRRWPDWSRP